MTKHLDTETINGLLTRTLEARRLRELDQHVQSCLECSLAIKEARFNHSIDDLLVSCLHVTACPRSEAPR